VQLATIQKLARYWGTDYDWRKHEAENQEVLSFLRQINDQKKLVASICRGSLLVAKSGIAKGRHLTGFHLDKEFPDLVTARSSKPAVGFGAMTVPSVVDGNLVSSRHPNDIEHFVGGIRSGCRSRVIRKPTSNRESHK
jgi:putative intracellular protease/amidase